MIETIKFDVLSERAFRHLPIPENSTMFERCCYQLLEINYRSYERSEITLEEAKENKRKIQADYEKDCLMFGMYSTLAEREKKINLSGIMRDIELSDCPYCKKLIRILDGRQQI